MNGRALTDLKDELGQTIIEAGQQLDGFAQLRDDGTTMSGCWIFSGCYTEQGNQMARRDASDPRDQGIAPGWAWAWPANRRILYNRASADLSGKPWNPAKPIIEWNGAKWVGIDVPDYVPTTPPSAGVGPFIMQAEGLGRLFALDQMAEGPFPEHYEPFESPSPNVLHPKVATNPAARVFPDDRAAFGTSSDFPYVATTHRLTEHFHFWTKHALINRSCSRRNSSRSAKRSPRRRASNKPVGCASSSKRGVIVCKAYVSKRMQPLTVDGKPMHVIGVPLHWGFTGQTRKGYGANTLTPSVGDANTANARVQSVPRQYREDRGPVA